MGLSYKAIADGWDLAVTLSAEFAAEPREGGPLWERLQRRRSGRLGLPATVPRWQLQAYDLAGDAGPSEPPQVLKQIDRLLRRAMRWSWAEIRGMSGTERDEALGELRSLQTPRH